MTESDPSQRTTTTVLVLFFCLLGLIVLLFFLYKKLNKEANGEYTIRRMVYKEGGVRDRVRGATLALETRLGVRLWPGGDTNEDGEGMEEIQDEEGRVEDGGSENSDSEGGDGEEEDEEDSVEQENGKGGDTDDNSSVVSSEAGEEARLTDQSEEKVGDGEGKAEASGGAGLLIDLKQFSGSAIWSEEGGGEGKESDVTAL